MPNNKDRVPSYVLHDFAKADQDWLADVISGISDGAAYLATGDDGRFMNAVALRVTPPRSRTSKTMAADQKKGPPAPEPERGTRSALQKLADRFR